MNKQWSALALITVCTLIIALLSIQAFASPHSACKYKQLSQEDSIRELVLRSEMSDLNHSSNEDDRHYFLAVAHRGSIGDPRESRSKGFEGCDDFRSPSRLLMAQFYASIYPVSSESRLDWLEKTYPRKSSLEEGFGDSIWVEPLHWVNPTTVNVRGGFKCNAGGDSDYGATKTDLFRVVKRRGHWMILSKTQLMVAG